MAEWTNRFLVARIQGSSMLPTLEPEDEVLVDLSCRSPRQGDLVAIHSGLGLVLHRVVDLSETGIATRGDNRPTFDGVARLDSIAGKVVLVRGSRNLWRKPSSAIAGRLSRTRLGRGIRLFARLARERAEEVLSMKQRFETQELGKELAVHDRVSGEVHLLNETAAMIWSSVRRGETNAQAVQQIAEHYRVEPDMVRKDVEEILCQFASKGLLDAEEGDNSDDEVG